MIMKFLDQFEKEARAQHTKAIATGDMNGFFKWLRDKQYSGFLAGKKAVLKDKAGA